MGGREKGQHSEERDREGEGIPEGGRGGSKGGKRDREGGGGDREGEEGAPEREGGMGWAGLGWWEGMWNSYSKGGMASIKLKFVQILDPLSPRREKKNLDYRYYGF
ncbi:hypothetical protein [Oryza sativa Japonica Group]|uniref:Uncharacterized protein B1146F03.3 n=1 Tax=Oryza sativa subsp. japonica TaxID=39947 RepID=Q657I4_ORYSJ|nr:hypothetical protein [Oryza sativa Japonica Group]